MLKILSRAIAHKNDLGGVKVGLLRGWRDAPPADIAARVDAALAFATMAGAAGDRVLEAEINPLFVLTAGQGVRAVDGLIVLR